MLGQGAEELRRVVEVEDVEEGDPAHPGPNPEVHAALPTLEAVHTTYIATHKFPPRAMRGELARALTTLWGQMADRGLEHHYTLQQQQQQQVAMKTGEE